MNSKSFYLGFVLILSLSFETCFPLITHAEESFLNDNVGVFLSRPKLWVTPLILDFGPIGVGSTSPYQTATITNLGSATLTNFAGGGVYSPFHASQNCASGVPPGGSCQYFFSFSPTAVGTFTATSNSSTNAGPFSIELRGTGIGADLWVTPLSLDFGWVTTGSTSEVQTVTIKNTGRSTLTNFAGGGVYSPFHVSQNCASGVPPGESCQYFFSFSPTETGTFTATSNSSTNAGPFSIALKGRGRSSLLVGGQRVSPLIIDFGPVGVGNTSTTQTATITNQSIVNEITNWVGGGVYPPFHASQNCVNGVPPGGSCQYFFSFSPTEAGTFTAVSSTSNSFGNFSIELRGSGVGSGVTVSPLALDFGPVPIGNTGATQTVNITNTGLSTLSGFAGGGVYPPFSASQNCASGVPPGETCQYFFSFTPTAIGRYRTFSNTTTNGGSFSIELLGGEYLHLFLPLVNK